MSQIKNLLNNLYGNHDAIRYKFLMTLAKLNLYKFPDLPTGRRPRSGPKR